MGIFLNIDTSKIRRLNEFEDENGNNDTDEIEDNYEEGGEDETNNEEDTGTTDTQTDTDAEEGETDNPGEDDDTDGAEGDEGAEDIGAGDEDEIEDGGYTEDEGTEGENTGGGEEDDEYRIDDTGDEENPEGGEGDDLESGNDTTGTAPDDSKLKQLEGELFDQLTDDQKKIKINELKKCFEEMHTRCDTIINMINNVTAPDEDTSRIFEYLNNTLTDLKQYIYDYFTYTFDTKTYLENSAQYHKYIAVLNSLNGVLEEVIKKQETDSKK